MIFSIYLFLFHSHPVSTSPSPPASFCQLMGPPIVCYIHEINYPISLFSLNYRTFPSLTMHFSFSHTYGSLPIFRACDCLFLFTPSVSLPFLCISFFPPDCPLILMPTTFPLCLLSTVATHFSPLDELLGLSYFAHYYYPLPIPETASCLLAQRVFSPLRPCFISRLGSIFFLYYSYSWVFLFFLLSSGLRVFST